MASAQSFSLFPNSVPKIAIPNPHKRTPSLHYPHSAATPRPDTMISPSGESIVIKIEQEPPVPSVPDQGHLQSWSRTPSPEDIGRAVTTSSPIDGRTPAPPLPPPPTRVRVPPPPLASSPQVSSSPEPGSIGSTSATLVQGPGGGTSTKSYGLKSPVVPIRSMFPTYDPSLPLHRQNYYPQRPLPARLSGIPISREEYRGSLSTPFDRAMGQMSAPPSVLNFPVDALSISGPRYSSARELDKLWEASHGAEPNDAIKMFDLEMARIDEATFVFGSDPGFPFYTLQTFDTNEIAVTKTCPQKRTLTRDVVLASLEPASRRLPPNDGLVTFIFPKPAALLAINQSAALTREYSLAPTDRDDVEAAAVRRAAEQEACSLRWNPTEKRYELEHPAIGRRMRVPDFAKSPMSPRVKITEGEPVLHITVSSHAVNSSLAGSAAPPVIMVTNPNALPTPASSAAAGIRLSTLPQSDADAPLASLDLGSQTLHIDANHILDLMPSLFAIDSIVCAIMAIAVADEATNPAMAAMDIWTPRPRLARSAYGGSVKSHAGSVFYTTIAEREHAEKEAKLMKRVHDQDMRDHHKSETNGGRSRSWFGPRGKKEMTQTKNKKQQIVIGEFDMEKLGHYQSGDRKGQELPGITRTALSVLVMGLKLVVWALTMLVQCLAWMLVNVSRAVTSDKF